MEEDNKSKLIVRLIIFFTCILIAIIMFILNKNTNIIVLLGIFAIIVLIDGIIRYANFNTKLGKFMYAILIIILAIILGFSIEFLLCSFNNPNSLLSSTCEQTCEQWSLEHILEDCD